MKIKNGFSLIEVLIAVGLMSMIGLAMASYFQNNLKAQQSIGKGYEKDALHEEIRRFLSNEIDCAATFGGIDPTVKKDVPQLTIAPNIKSKYYAGNDTLGGGHIKITKMTWQDYAASTIANSGVATLSIDYQKVGESIGPADYKPKTIEISVQTDPLAGNTLKTCQSRSAMTDGLWTRSIVPDLDASQKNIFYNAGTVGVGTDKPHSGSSAHFHNSANQGSVYISGAGDAGPTKATWSALYLGDKEASNIAAASKQWVLAYKGLPGGGETDESFIIAYQKRNAGTWSQSMGYSGLVLTPPDFLATPPTQGTMGVGTSAPNTTEIAHFHNPNWQGAVMVSGLGDGDETWSSFTLSDKEASNIKATSHQWAMAYKKKPVGNETPESLLFTYQTRAAGGWALGGGGSTPLTITPPNTNSVAKGGIGIFIEQPKAELHVDGEAIITKLATVNSLTAKTDSKFLQSVAITNDLSVTNVTASGTVTAASDRRLKKDIQPIMSDLLPFIEKLRPVSYLRKDEKLNFQGREIGFIAQDLEMLFPELVRENSSTHMKGINYGQLTAVLTKGMQELHQQNLQCTDENKNLKKQMAAMEERLLRIERALSRE